MHTSFATRFARENQIHAEADARVWLAYDALTNQKVVIKEAVSPERVRQLHNECRFLRSLRHSGIIKMVNEDTENETMAALQYAPGGDLYSVVEGGRQSEDLAKKTAKRVLESLKYLHCQKIIHRDIKLENILITDKTYEGDNVVLADFGVALQLDSDDSFKTPVASLEYAAPEIVCRKPMNEKVDIWALGVTIFACLTGRLPFSDPQPNTVVREIRRGLPVFKRLAKSIRGGGYAFDLLSKMLAYDPSNRISASDALKHQWFSI